ncbi:MAG: 30S ribosomal protein S2 [Bacteroidetes bacterium]|nr:30S ribosomal protein S2 [Bacteroidota bacterium]
MANSHLVSVQTLLEAGAHFGHITRRWNPKMAKFIYGEKNGIHQIDLRKTQLLIDYARDVMFEIAAKGHEILFVGTKSNAKEAIEEQAQRAKIHYVSERWLGGMLTNFLTIRKSINRLSSIDKMEFDGTFDNITKKERLLLTREKDRLRKVFGGIETMRSTPGVIFVVDAKKEHLAVKEAKVLGIPVIAIVDTNTDPDSVDYPIPANDESKETAQIITAIMADAVIEGKANAKIRAKELGYDPNKKEQIYEKENSERSGFDRDRRGGRSSDRSYDRGSGRGGSDRRDRREADRRESGEDAGTDRRGARPPRRTDDATIRTNERTNDRPPRRTNEGTTDRPPRRTDDASTDRPPRRTSERTTDRPPRRTDDASTDRPPRRTSERTEEKAAEKTTLKDNKIIRSRKKSDNTTTDDDSNSTTEN